eukprot:SAG31_NODE_2009_length_6673_cov_3.370094_3_plen_178_part_00
MGRADSKKLGGRAQGQLQRRTRRQLNFLGANTNCCYCSSCFNAVKYSWHSCHFRTESRGPEQYGQYRIDIAVASFCKSISSQKVTTNSGDISFRAALLLAGHAGERAGWIPLSTSSPGSWIVSCLVMRGRRRVLAQRTSSDDLRGSRAARKPQLRGDVSRRPTGLPPPNLGARVSPT